MQQTVFVIAEAGVNHNGDIELAKHLIRIAADAGADAVKFQTFQAAKMISRFASKAAYQKERTGKDESQLEMVKKLELSPDAHIELIRTCQEQHIAFLSTPFDLESIALLDRLGLDMLKIPSGEITNLPYLKKIGGLNKKLILSSGMADLGEIEDALTILETAGTPREQITVLHCNTEYPTPMQDVNLRAMLTIREAFHVRVGYSDHTPGIEIPIAAVALGATVIEKHFTLDKRLPGPDHQASLAPDELNAMITAIRNVERALGNGIKQASPSEMPNRAIVRKSVVAARSIRAGEIFTEENLAVKRPEIGISPMEWNHILGRAAAKDFAEDECITF